MSQSKLHFMIAKWKEMRAANSQWQLLLNQREELQDAIDRLNEELYDFRLKNQEAEKKEELIAACKEKKKAIDALLDELEENSEGDHLLETIIKAILAEHPEEAGTYETLDSALHCALKMEREGLSMQQILNQVVVDLDKIAAIRERIKQKGVISYIFGPNPNGMIALHLLSLKHALDESLPQVEALAAKTGGGDDLRLVYAEIISWFGELRAQCEEHWSFKKLDAFIAKGSRKWSEFDRYFTLLHNQEQVKRLNAEEKLKAWLEQFETGNPPRFD